MKWNKIKLSSHWLNAIILTLLGVFLILFFFWLQENKEEEEFPLFPVALFWILCLIFLLWLGNWLIYWGVKKWYPESRFLVKRFAIQLLFSTIYSLLCINLSYYWFKEGFTNSPPDENQMLLINLYGMFFLLPVMSIQFGFYFMAKWRKAVVEQERMTKAQIQTELSTLKAHIAPHFLFNNLNILSALIEPQNYLARNFLDNFSEVYRYLLKNREEELIVLKEELRFLDAYKYLLKKRFEQELQINLRIHDKLKKYLLPPLVLQILLENVLKHNKFSREKPLEVNIYTTEEPPMLIVKNNLQLKKVVGRQGSQTPPFGLENIRRRYWLLIRQEIYVHQDEEYFSVSVPLITPI